MALSGNIFLKLTRYPRFIDLTGTLRENLSGLPKTGTNCHYPADFRPTAITASATSRMVRRFSRAAICSRL